jgi:hypothetical protein
LALVLLDLIRPSRSNAGFGSRRGRLSPSHDRIRSETRNKPAHRSGRFALCPFGSHQFSSGQALRVILCSGKRTYFTILAVPFVSTSATTFHGETWRLLLSCARRRNAAAGVYLPARSFGGRPPSVSAASIAAIAAATFAFAELSCPAVRAQSHKPLRLVSGYWARQMVLSLP